MKLLGRTGWHTWQFLFILSSLSWLLAPALNHHLSRQQTLISEFESPGLPYAGWFRFFDLVAATLLMGAVGFIYSKARRRQAHIPLELGLLALIAFYFAVDAVFPQDCIALHATCQAYFTASSLVHGVESVLAVVTVGFLSFWQAYRRKSGTAQLFVAAELVLLVLIAFAKINKGLGYTPIQVVYELLSILWLSSVVVGLALPKRSPRLVESPLPVRLIAAWLFASGAIGVLNALLHTSRLSHLSALYAGENTAWLAQHGIIVGIVLMYISRHLWRGERRAWQLACALLWIEALGYALIAPRFELTLLYMVSAAQLYVSAEAFTRQSGTEQLRARLKALGLVLATSAVIFIITVITVEHRRHGLSLHPRMLDIDFNFSAALKDVLLFNTTHGHEKLPVRLLGQTLNVLGGMLILTFLAALFAPRRPLLTHTSQDEAVHVRSLLEQYGRSSEDYFKLWPSDKTYWWNADRTAFVAYTVVDRIAFALADPIASSAQTRAKVRENFLLFCRQQGWRACFLMVEESATEKYAADGYKILRIGASAVISIEQFTTTTMRSKWWRWALNKTRKQGLVYSYAVAPHSPTFLRELRQVSDDWLTRAGHKERGFALGYFDEQYMQDCRIHILRDEQGKLVAFANQLPVFNNLPIATVDLMRFMPDVNQAMPALLASLIEQLGAEKQVHYFDLGFVPLAAPKTKQAEILTRFGQLLMRESMSSKGLEQFKNKFEPDWRGNYIAFDGDWADLIHVTRYLEKAFEVE